MGPWKPAPVGAFGVSVRRGRRGEAGASGQTPWVRVRNSRVVVTGASSGIGLSTALLLARRGAEVVAVGRNVARLHEMADCSPRITPVVADVTVETDRARIIDAADGRVDVLVNNAGVGWTGMVEQMPAAAARGLFETNVLALIDLTQRVLPGMLERRHGHVCNIASVAGFVSVPPVSVYCATKFAVQGFSEGLRREVGGRGVVVTCVNPGPVSTRWLNRAMVADRMEVDTTWSGVPPGLVAFAVYRAILLGRLPFFGSIAVPRLAGLSRLGAVPGIVGTVDAGAAALGFLSRFLGPPGPPDHPAEGQPAGPASSAHPDPSGAPAAPPR